MENKLKTLTIDELTELTGFDRRTIAYYVQEGLLPKVGRRGRLTRYTRLIADRLLFIKLLREAEETGERPMPMTLAEIRDVFERTSPELIAEIAAGKTPVDAIDQAPTHIDDVMERMMSPASADHVHESRIGPPDMASRELRMRFMLQETDEPDLYVPGSAPDRDATKEHWVAHCEEPPAYNQPRMSRLPVSGDSLMDDCASGPPPDPEDNLSELLTHLSRVATRTSQEPEGTEHWTHVAITPGFKLAARDLDEWETRLLEKLAKLLRREIDQQDE